MPIFAVLKRRLDYLTDRQRLIAENVANSDTPGFAPRDLKPFTIPGGLGGGGAGTLAPVTMSTTSGMHLAPPNSTPNADTVVTPDSESTLNGNSVVLEEEMMKMTEARTDYSAAIGFYQRSLGLLQLAIKRPNQ
jgi:flagellar basal-body rod protein FlgB